MDTYYKISGERLTEIADAIREKTGGTAKMTLDEMSEEIKGIQTGGGGSGGSGGMVMSAALLGFGYTVIDDISLSVEIPDETEETTE